MRSVANSDLTRALTVIVDDASGDAESLGLLREFEIDTPLVKIFKRERRQIHHSLDLGWSLVKALGCRYLTNLDADAIVAPNWLSVLEGLYTREARRGARLIASAFNRSREKHVVSEHKDFKVKTRMGGVNYFFVSDLYPELRSFLINTSWDLLIQAHFEINYGRGYRLVCTKPSYVQHVGRIGMNSGPFQEYDTADDFVGEQPVPASLRPA